MQHAKQESAQESTDDSYDQIIDDSLAFPFGDQACEPAGQSARTKQYPLPYVLLTSLGWCTSIGLLESRTNPRRLMPASLDPCFHSRDKSTFGEQTDISKAPEG